MTEKSKLAAIAIATAMLAACGGETPAAPAKEEAPPPRAEPVVFPATPPDVPKPEEPASARRSAFSIW